MNELDRMILDLICHYREECDDDDAVIDKDTTGKSLGLSPGKMQNLVEWWDEHVYGIKVPFDKIRDLVDMTIEAVACYLIVLREEHEGGHMLDAGARARYSESINRKARIINEQRRSQSSVFD